MKTSDYIITRVSYNLANTQIAEVDIFKVAENDSINTSEIINRATLKNLLQRGSVIFTGKFNEEKTHTKLSQVFFHHYFDSINLNNYSSTIENLGNMPFVLPRRKTFISYYHKDDEAYRTKFENLTQDLLINKSVKDGDIDSENSADYIKSLIQKEYLKDATVLVVLVGTNTKCRKHVDWEISGAISTKVGGHSGLIGIILPTHPDYGKGKFYYQNIPDRLADNVKSEYAVMIDWTDDRVFLQNMIELAFDKRTSAADKRDNSTLQMQKNTCS